MNQPNSRKAVTLTASPNLPAQTRKTCVMCKLELRGGGISSSLYGQTEREEAVYSILQEPF
jgi:hypothetical protein